VFLHLKLTTIVVFKGLYAEYFDSVHIPEKKESEKDENWVAELKLTWHCAANSALIVRIDGKKELFTKP